MLKIRDVCIETTLKKYYMCVKLAKIGYIVFMTREIEIN